MKEKSHQEQKPLPWMNLLGGFIILCMVPHILKLKKKKIHDGDSDQQLLIEAPNSGTFQVLVFSVLTGVIK